MNLDISTVPEHMQVSNVNWQDWQPDHVCTLMFVRQDDEVLLIRKKRGLGAGKINGPGGKVDPGENPIQCAIRETEEELHVTPKDPELIAELFFHAEDDMPRIHAFAYVAHDFDGEPTETEEAIPLWFKVDEIPYAEMWQDDVLWLGAALNGARIRGWMSFEGEALIDYKIELKPIF